MEKGMISYRKILEEYLGHSIEEIEGLGAAGGLGAALYGFLNGKMQSGIDVLLELNNFEEKLDSTDIVITGEGKTDYSQHVERLSMELQENVRNIMFRYWLFQEV